ncbi:hypothetical protein K503DRAFT_392697 [Rhizopogon vinicolor AM-OR11-026]|uniref:Uncharacterized protein n=1 Tax=Rhizopogon vinicolor AM-OR11-026 TaxID=1314800 RepID=A0A1B7MRB3_9AGAM|nr:hypothetical protein K503DRAFT_392697 [Rhizopogon vinicolor AM-OR11-026]
MPERINGTSAVAKSGRDIHGKQYLLGESGARAELVLTNGQEEFSATFEDNADPSNVNFTTIDHVFLIGEKGKERYITANSSADLFRIARGEWDEFPQFLPVPSPPPCQCMQDSEVEKIQ